MFGIAAAITGALTSSGRPMLTETIPQILASSNTLIQMYVSNNTAYSYPLKFHGVDCSPYDLEMCESDSNSSEQCCKYFRDRSISPQQQVDDIQLCLLSILLPLLILVIRVLLWRYFDIKAFSTRRACDYYWILTFWDSFIGLLSSAVVQFIICNYMKLFVHSPRPIYYSLRIWSNLYRKERLPWMLNSNKSFPSGHSSFSMSTLGYTAFCIWDDAYHLLSSHEPASKLISYVGICVFSVSMAVVKFNMCHLIWAIVVFPNIKNVFIFV